MGCSSGGAAALTMGWFRPDLFRRLITYSGTFVDQQDDDAPEEKRVSARRVGISLRHEADREAARRSRCASSRTSRKTTCAPTTRRRPITTG